jgi:flagellar L-ring protein FlgH
MRRLALSVVVLLAGCSTQVQDTISSDFAPVWPEPPMEATRQMPTGSIYSDTAPGLFAADRRAARVGDILTVEIRESFAARDTQSTSTGRSDEYAVQLPGVITGAFGIESADLSAGAESGFSGSGSTSQNNSLSGRFSVTVTRLLPGGNLEIMGQRRLQMTSGVEYVRLRGMVRPSDISPENVVRSDRIANAEIHYVGAGDVSDASRQGWMRRAINTVTPF